MARRKTSIKKTWHRWRYKNTLLLVLSLFAFYYLAQTPVVDNFFKQVGTLGYVGAFLTGMFFVSTFTVAPAAVVLYHIAERLHPVEVALLAGLGAMVGDFVIFRFVKDRVFEELSPLYKKYGRPYTRVLFKSPYFAWIVPIFGAAIIASPFPDEIGVSILGLSKMRTWQFFLVTFILNSLGIFIIVTAARI